VPTLFSHLLNYEKAESNRSPVVGVLRDSFWKQKDISLCVKQALSQPTSEQGFRKRRTTTPKLSE
jgi:hypothetical protein